MSSSSSSSSSSPPAFAFPPLTLSADLTVADDSKESYPTSLFASSHPNYRTIEALPSPSSSTPSPFTREQPLYRSTAALAELDDSSADTTWPHNEDGSAAFGHKELTLTHIRDVGELPTKHSQLPDVRVAPRLSVEVPPLPPVFEGQYALAACRPCEVVMATLPQAFASFHLEVSYELHPSKPRISGVFYDHQCPVHFQVNVFFADGVGVGSTVIEVQRRAGDLRAFHGFFLSIQQYLTSAGILHADLHQSHYPMESLSPPPFDGADDAALDLVAQNVYKAKALSLNHSDAREGLRGLLTSPTLPLADVCPLMEKAMSSAHDAEQQRLAFALFQQSLVCASPSGALQVEPLLPALFECMGDLSPGFASVDAARSLVRICDAMEANPQLKGRVGEHAELLRQVKQMSEMVRV